MTGGWILIDTCSYQHIIKFLKVTSQTRRKKKVFYGSWYTASLHITILCQQKPNLFYIIPDDFLSIENEIKGLPFFLNYQYNIFNNALQYNILNQITILFQDIKKINSGQIYKETRYLNNTDLQQFFS